MNLLAAPTSTGTSTGRCLRKNSLPLLLHDLLDRVEEEGKSHVISWVAKGRAFKIHHKEAFVAEIMPQLSKAATFKSFQRSLNLWDYRLIRTGDYKGYISHPLFRRGDRRLCQGMQRIPYKFQVTEKEQDPSRIRLDHCLQKELEEEEFSNSRSSTNSSASRKLNEGAMKNPRKGLEIDTTGPRGRNDSVSTSNSAIVALLRQQSSLTSAPNVASQELNKGALALLHQAAPGVMKGGASLPSTDRLSLSSDLFSLRNNDLASSLQDQKQQPPASALVLALLMEQEERRRRESHMEELLQYGRLRTLALEAQKQALARYLYGSP